MLHCQAVCVTVDAPLLGRREKDMRNKFTLAGTDVQKVDDEQGKVDRSQGTARTISAYVAVVGMGLLIFT